jgi:hypothetical protein
MDLESEKVTQRHAPKEHIDLKLNKNRILFRFL